MSTKVYLSSAGVDTAVRETNGQWKRKFQRQGISGTAVVFDNARTATSMNSFPPEEDALQESFVAVFTGPDVPPQYVGGIVPP